MREPLPSRLNVGSSGIYEGNCLALIPKLPDDSIDVVVTSPPYWGQRQSLGNGTEEDPRDYLAFLQSVFDAILPKLKLNGIVWLNLGDAYNTPVNWGPKDHKYSSLGVDKNGFGPENSAYTKPRFKRKAFIDKSAGWLQYGEFADASATALNRALRKRLCLPRRGNLVEKERHAGRPLPPATSQARIHFPVGQTRAARLSCQPAGAERLDIRQRKHPRTPPPFPFSAGIAQAVY